MPFSLPDFQTDLATDVYRRQKAGGPGWSPEEREIGTFNENEQLALETVRQQRNDASRAQQQGLLEGQITQDAMARTPYALNPRDNSLENQALANPALAHLFSQGLQTPEQSYLSAGQKGLGTAQSAAGQLSGAGSFLPTARGMGSEYAGDINLLRESALGRGPSAAQAMMRSSLDANARGARSLAAGARGGLMAGGLRAAIGAGNAANAQAIQQMAALRANEQLSAQAQLPGAQAARMGALTGAANAETARQAAAGQAGVQAAGAASDLGRTAIAGNEARTQALNAAAGQHTAGVNAATGARSVQAGIARDAAADAEEQRRRAIMGYQAISGTAGARDQLRNQRLVARMGGEITPATALGIGANVAGTALGLAIPGGK